MKLAQWGNWEQNEWIYYFFWNSWDIQALHPEPHICKTVKVFGKCFGDIMPGFHSFFLYFSVFFRCALICGNWKGYWKLVTKVRRVRYRARCREREKEKIPRNFMSTLTWISLTSGFSFFLAHVLHERILKDAFELMSNIFFIINLSSCKVCIRWGTEYHIRD